ncbi:hypothetical protein EXE43_12730 [Halorubrum sp. SS5]|jgi:hypothetical protein|uniref:Uncharacterized protein n=1 Tax=Halorubrum salinarum TaxID=2739057 RepID=A0A7D3Y223_9EURY|nr:hypothetical protein [Halorubrum salinarum]QKG94414.1 hypothetical protein HPS36_16135 [Halorubrum salinarum]TKX85605.1 hypothetical protein EXE43_12730 [Halorubrum sp. SS5]
MKSRDIPVVSAVLEAGADDRVFDSLLLTGPLVIGLVVVFGRSLVTEAVAIAYIAAFVGYTLYRGVRT